MIVDKERRVIYLHNPKCGGTFLRKLYREKYGVTEATKWWKPYSSEYGMDLGHIAYNDLPRFVPDCEEYKMVVMVRNPYYRFYSGVNELRKHLSPFKKMNYFRHFWDEEWLRLNKFQKICELIRAICPGTDTHLLTKLYIASPEDACNLLFSLKRSRQDFFIRNKRIPWLNPQSDFIGKGVEVLRYESESDWYKLLELFGLSEYGNRLKIAKEYEIPAYICEKIKKLYPEDADYFSAADDAG